MGRLEDVSNMYRGQLASTVRYSESFKKQVVSEVESGKLNKDAAKRKYNIGGSTTVLKWCRKYGKNSTETSDPTELLIMKNKVSEAAYKKRIAELEQELSFSKLKSNYLECVITELEIAGGISAKKSVRTPLLDAKQSSPNLK